VPGLGIWAGWRMRDRLGRAKCDELLGRISCWGWVGGGIRIRLVGNGNSSDFVSPVPLMGGDAR